MNDALLIERDGAVLTLWLNRPELHNAFDASLIARLTAALEAAFSRSIEGVGVERHGAGEAGLAGQAPAGADAIKNKGRNMRSGLCEWWLPRPDSNGRPSD